MIKIRGLRLLLLIMSILLLLMGCGNDGETPTEETAVSPTGEPATPTATASQPLLGVATVDSIEVMIMESFPVQISVRVRGELPDGCTRISDVNTLRNGNEYNTTITTIRDADAVCTEALVPFEETIPLDVEGIPAGSYTVNVNGRTGSFSLEVDNVPGAQPSPTPEPEEEDSNLALINGRVWHDLCAVAEAEDGTVAPSEGCIAIEGEDGFQANSLLEDGEPGLVGVLVDLGEGDCPATGLDQIATDEDGDFIFTELPAGTYCVSISLENEGNAELLDAGTWTFPESGVAETAVEVGDGEIVTGINFGWDFDFLPVPEVDLDNCTNSIAFVDDLSIPDDTVIAPGESFEKRWRLRNSGTCPWTTDYSLTYVGDELPPVETSIPLTSLVVPGQTVDLSASFVAPETPGTYRSDWQISDGSGQPFGIDGFIEEAFWVQIVVGVPQPTPVPGSSAIGGVVWEDVCFITTDGNPSRGCVEIGESGQYRADGSLNFNEARLVGITVTLVTDACNEDGTINRANILQTTVTDDDGLYRFTGLDEGLYCVAIDAFSDDNLDLLIPGDWTWPFPGVGQQGVVLDAGEELLTIDFGWDYLD